MAQFEEVRITGIVELRAKLDKLQRGVSLWTQPLETVGKVFTKFFSTVPFASRGNVYGVTWQPLSMPYATHKADKWGGGKPILIASGNMSTRFTFISTKNQVKIYNTSKLFPHHQFGTRQGLPQRVMMKLDRQRRQLAIDTVKEELHKKVNEL